MKDLTSSTMHSRFYFFFSQIIRKCVPHGETVVFNPIQLVQMVIVYVKMDTHTKTEVVIHVNIKRFEFQIQFSNLTAFFCC